MFSPIMQITKPPWLLFPCSSCLGPSECLPQGFKATFWRGVTVLGWEEWSLHRFSSLHHEKWNNSICLFVVPHSCPAPGPSSFYIMHFHFFPALLSSLFVVLCPAHTYHVPSHDYVVLSFKSSKTLVTHNSQQYNNGRIFVAQKDESSLLREVWGH